MHVECVAMASTIVNHLRPAFEPAAVAWRDAIYAQAFQFQKGSFGGAPYPFAEACKREKIAGGSRESIPCTGGRADLFSKGRRSAKK